MANFEKELGIDDGPVVSQSKTPSLVIVKSQFPFFVFPLCLVCALLCIHAGVKDFQQRRMGREIEVIGERSNLALERTHLLGIVHNENFARLSKATGVKPIYIGEDWKINEMPRHLRLTPEAYQYLWFKYYGEPPVTPSSSYRSGNHCGNGCQASTHACERDCARRCLARRCLQTMGNVLRWIVG